MATYATIEDVMSEMTPTTSVQPQEPQGLPENLTFPDGSTMSKDQYQQIRFDSMMDDPTGMRYEQHIGTIAGKPGLIRSGLAGTKQWAASQLRLLDWMGNSAIDLLGGSESDKNHILTQLSEQMDPSDWELSNPDFFAKAARVTGYALPDLAALTQLWMKAGTGMKMAATAGIKKLAERTAEKGIAKEAAEKAAREVTERYARVGAEEEVAKQLAEKAGKAAGTAAIVEAGETAAKRFARKPWEGIPVFAGKGAAEAGSQAAYTSAGVGAAALKGAILGGATGAAFVPLHGAPLLPRTAAMAGIGVAGAALGGAADIEDYAIEAMTMAGFSLLGGRGIKSKAERLGWSPETVKGMDNSRIWDIVEKGIRGPKDLAMSQRLQSELGYPEELANQITKEQGDLLLKGGIATGGKPLRYTPEDFLNPMNPKVDWIGAPGDDVYLRIKTTDTAGKEIGKIISLKLGREVVAAELVKVADKQIATNVVPQEAIDRAALVGVEIKPGQTWSEYAKAMKDFRLELKRKDLAADLTNQKRQGFEVPTMDINALAEDIAKVLEADPKAYSSLKYLVAKAVANYKARDRELQKGQKKTEREELKKTKGEERELAKMQTAQLREIFRQAKIRAAAARKVTKPVTPTPAAVETPEAIPLEGVQAEVIPAVGKKALVDKANALADSLKMPQQSRNELINLVSNLKGKNATQAEAGKVIQQYIAKFVKSPGATKAELQGAAKGFMEPVYNEAEAAKQYPLEEMPAEEVSQGKAPMPAVGKKAKATPLEEVYGQEVPKGEQYKPSPAEQKKATKDLKKKEADVKAAKANLKVAKLSKNPNKIAKAKATLDSEQIALESLAPKKVEVAKAPKAIVTDKGIELEKIELPKDVKVKGKGGKPAEPKSIYEARKKVIDEFKTKVDQLADALAKAQADATKQTKGPEAKKALTVVDKLKTQLKSAQSKVTQLVKKQAALMNKIVVKGPLEERRGPRPWFSEWLENDKGITLQDFFTEIEDIRHTSGNELAAARQLAYVKEYGARYPRTWEKGKLPKVDWKREAARKVPIHSWQEIYGLKASDGTSLMGEPLTEGEGKGIPRRLYAQMEGVNPFFANEWAKNWNKEMSGLKEGGKNITWGKLYDFLDRMRYAKEHFLEEIKTRKFPLYQNWITEFAKLPWTQDRPLVPGTPLKPQEATRLAEFLGEKRVFPDNMLYPFSVEDQIKLYNKFTRENPELIAAIKEAGERSRHTLLDSYLLKMGWGKNSVTQFVGNIRDLLRSANELRFEDAYRKLKTDKLGTNEIVETKKKLRQQMRLKPNMPEYDDLIRQQSLRMKNFKMSILEQGVPLDRDLWRYGFYTVDANGRVHTNQSILPVDRVLLVSPLTGEQIPTSVAIKMTAISRVTPKDMRRNSVLSEIGKIENKLIEMDNTLDRATRYGDTAQKARVQLALRLDQLYTMKAKGQAELDASNRSLAAASDTLPASPLEMDVVPGDISSQGLAGTGPIDDPFQNVKAVFLTPEEYEGKLNEAVRKGMASRKKDAINAATLKSIVQGDVIRQGKLVVDRAAAVKTDTTLKEELDATRVERDMYLEQFITNEEHAAFKDQMVLWSAVKDMMKGGGSKETRQEKQFLLRTISEEARKLNIELDKNYEKKLATYSTRLDALSKKVSNIEERRFSIEQDLFKYDAAIQRIQTKIEERMGKYENMEVVDIPITDYQKGLAPLGEAAWGKAVIMPTNAFRSGRSYIIGTDEPNVLETKLVRDVNSKVKFYINRAYDKIFKEYVEVVSRGERVGTDWVDSLRNQKKFAKIEDLLEHERRQVLKGNRGPVKMKTELLRALDRLIEMNKVRASMNDPKTIGDAEMTIVDKEGRIVEMNDKQPKMTIEFGYPEESFKRMWLTVNGWHLLNKGWFMQGRGPAWEDLWRAGRAEKMIDPNGPAGAEPVYRFLGEAERRPRGTFDATAYRPYEEAANLVGGKGRIVGPLRPTPETGMVKGEVMNLEDINWEGPGRKSVFGGTPAGVMEYRGSEVETTFLDKNGNKRSISAKALRDAEVEGFTGERKFIAELERDANHIVFGKAPWDLPEKKPTWMTDKEWADIVQEAANKKVDLKNLKYFDDWDVAVDYLRDLALLQHPSLAKGQAKNIAIVALKNTQRGMSALQTRTKARGQMDKMMREEYELTRLLKQTGRLDEQSRINAGIKLNAIKDALKSLGVPSLEERIALGMKPDMRYAGGELDLALAGRIAEEKLQGGRLIAPEFQKMRYLDKMLRELALSSNKGTNNTIEEMIRTYVEASGDRIPEGMKPSEWAQQHVGEWYNVNRKNVYDNATNDFADKFPLVNQFIELNPAEKAAALSTIKNAREIDFWKTMGRAALRNLYEENSLLREIPKNDLPRFLDEMKQLGFISEVDAFLMKRKGIIGGMDFEQANKAAQEAVDRRKSEYEGKIFDWQGRPEEATDIVAQIIKDHYNQGRNPGDLIGDARAAELARRYVSFIHDPKNADLGYVDPTDGTFIISEPAAVEVDFSNNIDSLPITELEGRGLAKWPTKPNLRKAAAKGVTLGAFGDWNQILGIGKNIREGVDWSVKKLSQMRENYKKIHPDMPEEAREAMIQDMHREQSSLRSDLQDVRRRMYQDTILPGINQKYGKWYEYFFDWFQDPTQSSNEMMRAVGDQGAKYELQVGNARRASTDYFNKHFAWLRDNPEKDLEMNNHIKKIKESSDPKIIQAAKDWRSFADKMAKLGQLEELGLYIPDYATFAMDYRKFYAKNRDAFMKANRYEDLDAYWQSHTTKDKFLELKEVLTNRKNWNDLSNMEKSLVTEHLFSWQQVAPEWDYLPQEIKMRLPKKLWNKYHQHRTLNAPEMTINSFVDTWDMYVPSMVNKIFGDQFLLKVRPLINSLPSGTGTIRNYLDKYVNRLMGRRGTDLDALSKNLTKAVGDVFGIDLAARYPVERVARAIIRQTYGAMLGISTAVRNTLQTIHTIVEAGPSATLRGIHKMVMDRNSPDFKFFQEMNHSIMKEFGHDIMGKPEFVHDAKGWFKWIGREWKEAGELGIGYEVTPEGKPYKEPAGGFDKWMRRLEIAHESITELVLSPMQFVENVNRGIAFFSGLDKAARMGKSYGAAIPMGFREVGDLFPGLHITPEQWAGLQTMWKTQYQYSTAHTSPYLASPFIKMLTMFWSYPLKTAQMIKNGFLENLPLRKGKTGAGNAIIDPVTGKPFDPESPHPYNMPLLGEDAKFLRYLGLVGFYIGGSYITSAMGIDTETLYSIRGLLPTNFVPTWAQMIANTYKLAKQEYTGVYDDYVDAWQPFKDTLGSMTVPAFRTVKTGFPGLWGQLNDNVQRGYRVMGAAELPLAETTWYDEFLSFLGFTPSKFRDARTDLYDLSTKSRSYNNRKGMLAARGAKAYSDGNYQEIDQVLKLAKKEGIELGMVDIRKAMEKKQRSAYETKMKQAPKALREQLKKEYGETPAIKGVTSGTRNMWSAPKQTVNMSEIISMSAPKPSMLGGEGEETPWGAIIGEEGAVNE